MLPFDLLSLIHAAAADYLRAGFVPVALAPRAKNPSAKAWPTVRPSLATISEHFSSSHGVPNIGVLLGEPSGFLFDVDVDSHEARLAAPHILPHTPLWFGRPSALCAHWLYRCDRPHPTQQFRDPLHIGREHGGGASLVELRGDGGQTMFPPSVHPCGEILSWRSMDDAPPQGKPLSLSYAELEAVVSELAACALLARYWPSPGGRNHAWLALAGALVGSGFDADRWQRFAKGLIAATRDEQGPSRLACFAPSMSKRLANSPTTGWPTLSEALGEAGPQVCHTARKWLGESPVLFGGEQTRPASATTTAALTPAPLGSPTLNRQPIAAFRPFPVAALPGGMREFVEQLAASLGCDPAFTAVFALPIAGALIGNTRLIELKETWREPAVIWSMLVSDSGTMKSPVLRQVCDELATMQAELLTEYEKAETMYDAQLQEWADGKGQGPKPRPPLAQRVTISDTTVEALATVLNENPRGVLVVRDEMTGWISSFTRYANGVGGDLPIWLELFNAGQMTVDRKTTQKRTLFVPRAFVGLTGGVQPAVLARVLKPEHFESGLVARILLAMPPRRVKKWNTTTLSGEVVQGWRALMRGLRQLDFEPGTKEPVVLRLCSDARVRFARFYDEWAHRQAKCTAELASAMAKLEAYCARLTLVHHVVESLTLGIDDRGSVGEESVEAGATLMMWFADECQRIYATLRESEQTRDQRAALELMRERIPPQISTREIARSGRRFRGAGTAQALLESLIEAGFVREVPSAGRGLLVELLPEGLAWLDSSSGV